MNRRVVMHYALAALAVIPGFTGIRPAMALPKIDAALPVPRVVPLAAVRDMLLPGLYARRGAEEIELDIQIDYTIDSLLVKGYSTRNKKELAFAITRSSIQDNTFKAQFNPSVLKLIDELKYGPVPQGAVL